MKQITHEIVLVVLAAALLVLSFPVGETTSLFLPEAPWEFCVFFALVPILKLQQDKKRGSAFRIGYIFGFLSFLGTLSWIVLTMLNYGNISVFLSYLLLTALVCYLAFYLGFFFLFSRILTDRLRIPFTFVAPAVWVVLEYIRSYAISGFPWNLLGYTLYKQTILIQIADIVGVYGLSFFIVAVNCLIYDLFFCDYSRRLKLSLSLGILGMLLLIVVYGKVRLSEPMGNDSVKVCLIQGNYRQEEKWAPGMKQTTLDTYSRLTQSTFGSNPDLIIWPEAALPFRLRYSAVAFNAVGRLARECDCQLLVGSPDTTEDMTGKKYFYNSAFLLNNRGEFMERYDKIHLVPFGEYVPLKNLLFFVEKLTEGATGDFSAGRNYTVFSGDISSFSVYICYETIFPDLIRKFSLSGARFLVSITNDAWFGRSAASYQHFTMTVFRAIENRCPVVRAANTGISGIIDQKGRIIDRTDIFSRTTLCGIIHARQQDRITVYTKWGDFFTFMCSIAVLIMASLALLFMKRKNRE